MSHDTEILSYAGDYVDLCEPKPQHLKIEVFAHALSNLCRFNGHCRTFYSVARHSILVSHIVEQDLGMPGYALEGLMHDASEAFLGDVTTLLKPLLPTYKPIERNFARAIRDTFGLAHVPEILKKADLRALKSERAALLPPTTRDWVVLRGVPPASADSESRINLYGMMNGPERDKLDFLERYNEIMEKRK